jgi:hypothetical protein
MNTANAKTRFTDNEVFEGDVERPFRPSSLLALALGVLSVGVLATIQLIILPIVAACVAVYALRPSRVPNVKPAGKSFALLGLALALLFGSWSLTYAQLRSSHLVSGAEAFAQEWLDLLGRGRREIAYELTLPQRQRQLKNMSLERYYAVSNKEVNQQFSSFVTMEAPQAIINAKGKPIWKSAGVASIYRQYDSDYIDLRMIDATDTISRPLIITLTRSPWVDSEGEADWTKPRQWHVRQVSYERR